MIEATPQTQVRPTAPPRVEKRGGNWRTYLLGAHSTLMYVLVLLLAAGVLAAIVYFDPLSHRGSSRGGPTLTSLTLVHRVLPPLAASWSSSVSV